MDIVEFRNCTIEQHRERRANERASKYVGVVKRKHLVVRNSRMTLLAKAREEVFDWCRVKQVFGVEPTRVGTYECSAVAVIDEHNERAIVKITCIDDDAIWFTIHIKLDEEPHDGKSDDSEDDEYRGSSDEDGSDDSSSDDNEESESDNGDLESEEEAQFTEDDDDDV